MEMLKRGSQTPAENFQYYPCRAVDDRVPYTKRLVTASCGLECVGRKDQRPRRSPGRQRGWDLEEDSSGIP